MLTVESLADILMYMKISYFLTPGDPRRNEKRPPVTLGNTRQDPTLSRDPQVQTIKDEPHDPALEPQSPSSVAQFFLRLFI